MALFFHFTYNMFDSYKIKVIVLSLFVFWVANDTVGSLSLLADYHCSIPDRSTLLSSFLL